MRPRTSRVWALASLLLILLVAGAVALTRAEAREVAYVIPAGTATRIAAGETIDVVPATIFLRAGDTLVIRNDDSEPVQIGPFRIEPGQRLAHLYRSPGLYELECTVHPQGALRIVVQ